MKAMAEVRVADLRPGDRITFGDHTGWYRVRKVEPGRLRFWWRRARAVDAWTHVWRGEGS